MVICWKSLKFYCHFRPLTLYFCRYSILAPNAIPQGFVDGKVVTEKVLAALQLDLNDYRLGHTKVFFRAGVLGALEDMRDERLSKIVSLFQAHIRGYTMRRSYNKLQDQRYAWLWYGTKRVDLHWSKLYWGNSCIWTPIIITKVCPLCTEHLVH